MLSLCVYYNLYVPYLISYLGLFFPTIYRLSTVDLSWIRTRIVILEGEHADHLTTTTAQGAAIILLVFLIWTECQTNNAYQSGCATLKLSTHTG